MDTQEKTEMKQRGRQRGRGALAALLTVGVMGLASCAGTMPIRGDDGAPVAGSIASLEKVEILGTQQWLLLRGHDVEAPVLLWLAGGPGGSEIGRTRDYLSQLEESFVFVNWEQPGTGKSFGALDARNAGYEEFVDHTIAVSSYLVERFGGRPIYLAGHSWGSIIGLLAAAKRPDLYAAYIGIGQQVDFVENDRIGYDLVLERAAAAGDDATVRKLEEQGPPPYTAEERGKYTYLFQRIFRYSPKAPDAPHIDDMSIFTPKEYTIVDTVNLVRGLIRGVNHIYPQLVGLDFRRDIPRLDLPVFFVTGRYDYTCVQDLTYEYFELLEAPIKRHYWFEKSGHESCYQEPEEFRRILTEEVLPLSGR
jgi:pimeloyl-ACP methyl ester carboxylesterase